MVITLRGFTCFCHTTIQAICLLFSLRYFPILTETPKNSTVISRIQSELRVAPSNIIEWLIYFEVCNWLGTTHRRATLNIISWSMRPIVPLLHNFFFFTHSSGNSKCIAGDYCPEQKIYLRMDLIDKLITISQRVGVGIIAISCNYYVIVRLANHLMTQIGVHVINLISCSRQRRQFNNFLFRTRAIDCGWRRTNKFIR